jgi:tRNA-binding EMAP/Myf-like protein
MMQPFTPAPVKAPISPELLEQLDIRVGTITAVDEVPGSDKLMRLTVDLGDHTRTILAGIKQERANPQEITLRVGAERHRGPADPGCREPAAAQDAGGRL